MRVFKPLISALRSLITALRRSISERTPSTEIIREDAAIPIIVR